MKQHYARCLSVGGGNSSTMIVMMMAITPSLKASSRVFSMRGRIVKTRGKWRMGILSLERFQLICRCIHNQPDYGPAQPVTPPAFVADERKVI